MVFTFIQAGSSCKWVDDSQHFVLEHFDTICNSPFQIYHSALPLCPPLSWLHKHYTTELSQEVKVVRGLPAEWETCSRTVAFGYRPQTLACWKDIIAVGLAGGEIIILDGIAGIQTAILVGHTDYVNSLAFFPDGTSLVSGGFDESIRLWDVQTGGVVKTFHGHTSFICSVSISSDCTTIASGSYDNTIHLWYTQEEGCYCVIEQQDCVWSVMFSPTDPQYLISGSGDKVWHWNINGHQTKPAQKSSCIAFSLDGAQIVLRHEGEILVQNSNSGEITANFHVADSEISYCCFSPDGRLIAAVAASKTVHVWETTSLHPHPIKTLVGYSDHITSLVFSSPSSLISSSSDHSVRFWDIGTQQADPVMADPKSTSLTSAEILSIVLQAEDGITISSDSDGVVRTWDISTGACKASFQTLAKHPECSDVQLINSRLIYVWCVDAEVHISDVEEGELLQTIDVGLRGDGINDVGISGDGSIVFCLYWQAIQALSIQTGEVVGEVRLEYCQYKRSLTVEGSQVWLHSPVSKLMGWDFGTPGSTPVRLSNSHLHPPKNAKVWDVGQLRIKDAVSGKTVFELSGRFTRAVWSQWDGHFLVAGYKSGEVLILDFDRVHF